MRNGNPMLIELKNLIYTIIFWLPTRIGSLVRRRCLPGRVGRSSVLMAGGWVDNPRNLEVGERTFINRSFYLNASGSISIGNDVLIGPNVTIYSQNHCYRNPKKRINEQGYELKPVVIADDVWICANVTILPGVSIDRGAVIAAGSVVAKNVEAYAVYAGNPAVKVSMRK
jgi:maltose O-acetyltransferase